MRKLFIPLCALTVLAAGCSRNGAGIDEPTDDRKEIVVASGVTATRTSVESDDDGIVTSHSELDVAFLRNNGATANWETDLSDAQTETGTGIGMITAKLKPATTTTGHNSIAFTSPQYYSGNPTQNVYLRGYYPATASLSYDAVEKVTEATWTVTGKVDLLASDYVTGNKATTSAIPVVFKHLLSKLTIKVIAENDGAKASWGEVVSMKIKAVPQKVKIAFDGDDATEYTATPIATPTTDIPVWGYKAADNSTTDGTPVQLELPVEGTDPAAVFGQTMVAPQGSYVIEIETTLHNSTPLATSTVSITGEAQPGQNHIITLTFKAGVIEATAKVVPWENGQEATGDVD